MYEIFLYIFQFIEYNQHVEQKRKGQMAEKSVKKTATKKTVAKKSVSKPAVAKKTTVKKATKVVAPAVETYPCGCNAGCACGGHCAEHSCCGKKKCSFGRFLKKLVVFLIIFALGFATAKMCCFNKSGKMGPRPEFENGCLVIKCPKMAERAEMMDTNKDGCINREEFRAARKMFKHKPWHAEPAPEQPETPAPDAPVAE